MIQNGTADMGLFPIYRITGTHLKYFDFSMPLLPNTFGFVMKKPELDLLTGSSLIFSNFTYGFLIISILTLIFAMVIAVVTVQKPIASLKVLLQRFPYFVGQGIKASSSANVSSKWRHNVLMVLIGYTILLVSGLYQGTLLTTLLFYKVPEPIGTFESLLSELRSRQIQLVSRSYSHEFVDRINHSELVEFR